MNEQQFLIIKDSSNIDLIEDNLYCYDSAVFGLTAAIQNRTSESLLRKIKDIPLGTKTIPTDVSGAMQCLSMQNQLNQISNRLKEISESCEFNFDRIIQGQRDDRLAKLLSSRSCLIQALSMSDELLQQQMLMQAVSDANSARTELVFQVKSDISLLCGDKIPKVKEMEKIVCDINTAIVAMNSAVQISLYSYQVLGERNAQLAVVKDHETFIKQVLLKQIEYNGNKYSAWELICSSGNSSLAPQDFEAVPRKLIASCNAFIENKDGSSVNYLKANTMTNEKLKQCKSKGCHNSVVEGKYCEYCKKKTKEKRDKFLRGAGVGGAAIWGCGVVIKKYVIKQIPKITTRKY